MHTIKVMKIGTNKKPDINDGFAIFSTEVNPAIKTNKAANPLMIIEKSLINFILPVFLYCDFGFDGERSAMCRSYECCGSFARTLFPRVRSELKLLYSFHFLFIVIINILHTLSGSKIAWPYTGSSKILTCSAIKRSTS